MKYLFTFAAVGSPICQRALEVAKNGSHSGGGDALLRSLEELLFASVTRQPDVVAFYRSVMDGWSGTHRVLGEWVSKCRPRAQGNWQEFCDRGVLVREPSSIALLGLEKCPNSQEIRGIVRRHSIEAYGIRAFIFALYDALEFAGATTTTFVAIGRCIGTTRGDDEY